jgi:tetratricopeptide (TPR) repeat protein
MDGRMFLRFCTFPALILLAGCTTTSTQKTIPTANTKPVRPEEVPVVKKADGPKRNPLPATEIAYGKMKEDEADTDAVKKQPQLQAAFRDEARKAYQQALKIDPNNLEAQRCLGRLYGKIGDFERAQAVFKKALEKYPKDAALWYEAGVCQNRRKEFSEGIRCLSKAVELDPENREYLKKLGFTLAWTGQVDASLRYLTRAYQSAGIAHYQIACMFDQKEQRGPAIHHLRLALRENSQLIEARELLEALERPDIPGPRRGYLESPVANR